MIPLLREELRDLLLEIEGFCKDAKGSAMPAHQLADMILDIIKRRN